VWVTATDVAGASVSSAFKITVANVNDAPTVANAIADQAATQGSSFSFVVPSNIFADVDSGDQLTYAATQADGSALPSWLSFDTATRVLSGTPTNAAVGNLNLKVTATDIAGTSASSSFDMLVASGVV